MFEVQLFSIYINDLDEGSVYYIKVRDNTINKWIYEKDIKWWHKRNTVKLVIYCLSTEKSQGFNMWLTGCNMQCSIPTHRGTVSCTPFIPMEFIGKCIIVLFHN